MTKEEAVQTSVRIKQFSVNIANTKIELHELACSALKQFHNHGQVGLIQELYDTLSVDKLMRHAAFAKWCMAYSPLQFDDKAKKFSKNKNPNVENKGLFLYHENEEEGKRLMGTAFGIRFWEIQGGEEQVNLTTWDILAKSLEKLVRKAVKDTEKGELSSSELALMNKVVANFNDTLEDVTPLTTKTLTQKALEAEKKTETKVA